VEMYCWSNSVDTFIYQADRHSDNIPYEIHCCNEMQHFPSPLKVKECFANSYPTPFLPFLHSFFLCKEPSCFHLLLGWVNAAAHIAHQTQMRERESRRKHMELSRNKPPLDCKNFACHRVLC
jgi:hypothetical protein